MCRSKLVKSHPVSCVFALYSVCRNCRNNSFRKNKKRLKNMRYMQLNLPVKKDVCLSLFCDTLWQGHFLAWSLLVKKNPHKIQIILHEHSSPSRGDTSMSSIHHLVCLSNTTKEQCDDDFLYVAFCWLFFCCTLHLVFLLLLAKNESLRFQNQKTLLSISKQ